MATLGRLPKLATANWMQESCRCPIDFIFRISYRQGEGVEPGHGPDGIRMRCPNQASEVSLIPPVLPACIIPQF